MIKFLIDMAKSRDDIKRELQSHQYQIQDNIVKIFLWHNTSTLDHWTMELYSQLNMVPKLKSHKSYPSKKFIMEYIYNEMSDVMDNSHLRKEICSDARIENKDIPNLTDDQYDNLRAFIKSYCEWLSDVLSSEGIVSTEEVFDKVKELIEIYCR